MAQADHSFGETSACGVPIVALFPASNLQGTLAPGDCVDQSGSYVDVYKFQASSEMISTRSKRGRMRSYLSFEFMTLRELLLVLESTMTVQLGFSDTISSELTTSSLVLQTRASPAIIRLSFHFLL
jgi:hypothetical protein